MMPKGTSFAPEITRLGGVSVSPCFPAKYKLGDRTNQHAPSGTTSSTNRHPLFLLPRFPSPSSTADADTESEWAVPSTVINSEWGWELGSFGWLAA